MKIASFITILSITIASINTLSAQLPIGIVTQKQKNEFARRFEHFADLTKKDSAQCCLLDFARIISSPTTNPLIVAKLIKLSKSKRVLATTVVKEIVDAFLPYFDQLPNPMKKAILELRSRGKFIDLLNKRVASNGSVACSYYPPGYKN